MGRKALLFRGKKLVRWARKVVYRRSKSKRKGNRRIFKIKGGIRKIMEVDYMDRRKCFSKYFFTSSECKECYYLEKCKKQKKEEDKK